MTGPAAVVFDIGNVLVGWNPNRLYDARLGAETRARLFAEVDLAGMNRRLDAGEPLAALVREQAERHPQWAEAIGWWHDDWHLMFGPPIDRSVRLMRRLRARGVPVFALSNFGADTFPRGQAAYPCLTEFDRFYISGRLRLLKPDPAIYAVVEADCGVPPAGLFFTDDSAANVAAAVARGWRGHVFDGPDGLATRLVAEGLLTEGEAE